MSENTTETLDKIYLEYSNLTSAKTRKELELQEEIDKRDARIKELEGDNRWLIACLDNFHPFKEQPLSGLFPASYQTLSYRGDLELFNRFQKIKEEELSGMKDE